MSECLNLVLAFVVIVVSFVVIVVVVGVIVVVIVVTPQRQFRIVPSGSETKMAW